jgi:5-hydroxyisourate hydrolase-like protein (transthyretin family)
MLRKLQWLSASAAMVMFALLYTPPLHADDAATTQPSAAANGSITVNVLDSSGKPASGIRVRLTAGRAKGASPSTTRPAALTGTTDDNGAYTFSGVAPGDYSVSARVKGGARGTAKVTLSEGENGAAPTATVTVNLPAPQGG